MTKKIRKILRVTFLSISVRTLIFFVIDNPQRLRRRVEKDLFLSYTCPVAVGMSMRPFNSSRKRYYHLVIISFPESTKEKAPFTPCPRVPLQLKLEFPEITCRWVQHIFFSISIAYTISEDDLGDLR